MIALISFSFAEDENKVYSLNTIESLQNPTIITKTDTLVSEIVTKDTLVVVKKNITINKKVTNVNLNLGDVGKSFENWFNSKQPKSKVNKKKKQIHPEMEIVL